MVVTRSMSQTTQKADTENAVRDKVTERASKEITVQRAEVTNTKSGTSQQQVDAEKNSVKHKYAARASMKLARPGSSGKYFDLDERTLAMGIFLDTLKEVCLKNDPDFTFTQEFYHAAMREFNSLNDDNKAMYIAEAKRRNSMEDNDVAASREVRKALKINNDGRDNIQLQSKAVSLYKNAMKAERLKNDPDFRFTGKSYGAGWVHYKNLDDDDKAPYIAEAMARYLDERVENLKKLAKFAVHGF